MNKKQMAKKRKMAHKRKNMAEVFNEASILVKEKEAEYKKKLNFQSNLKFILYCIPFFIIGIVFSWYIYNRDYADSPSITIDKYTIQNNILSTFIPKFDANYEISIIDMNIKEGDKIVIVPKTSGQNMYMITELSVNGVPLTKDNYPIGFSEIRTGPQK